MSSGKIQSRPMIPCATPAAFAATVLFCAVLCGAQSSPPGGQPEPVTISSGWLMQDIAHVTDKGDAISKVGFSPQVYTPAPYVAPQTASANPPTATVIPPEVRYATGGRGGGRAGGRAAAGGAGPATQGAATQGSRAGPNAGAAAPSGRGAGRGGGQWPVEPEANRPNLSSEWTQAPAPSSSAWYKATVPGTVLTTLVNNNVYPEPLYGENNRPNIIPESLSRTSYWYRTEVTVPADYAGKQIWLNFDGINYFANVWVNGEEVGTIKGAFIRGNFNITSRVKPGEKAAVAVFIIPPPHPGDPWEKTVANERGPNGGGTTGPLGQDGPTFVAAIGWDWVPGIRDRQIGIWQKVSLSATGPVVVQNPFVVTDLPLPKTDSADITIQATVRNVTNAEQSGVLTGTLGDITFRSKPITLAANSAETIKLDPNSTPQLHLDNPKLWWPNGFGDPYLYRLSLSFDINGARSDTRELNVGIRKVSYFVPGSTNLTLSVNGVPIFAKGGDWGMDEALKRIPRERLEAEVKLHKLANYTILRNWVGQSTSEDLFDLCDRYGIMVWDEFFQANPANGMNPTDANLYLSNVRDTVLRYRNHPSIVVWCGRNEGAPPPAINEGNDKIISELDQTRYYQASSGGGNGVASGGGGYGWRVPRGFYGNYPAFNTEVGSASIPTLEAIQSWMPQRDWFDKNFPNDDWAEHDLVNGAGSPANNPFHVALERRYGPYNGLPDFIRKAQMADYEAFRAMYEARASRLFAPCTAVITWMSNPAQPCLVWQIYDYSLEPFGSFFGVQKACEQIHIMMTQDAFELGVINNTRKALEGMKYRVRIYNLDGKKLDDKTTPLATAEASKATYLGPIKFPEALSPVHFIQLDLMDSTGKVISDNFYWRETQQDDLTALDRIPDVNLDARITRHDSAGNCLLDVSIANNTANVAVMAHLQLRNQRTGERVLPVYYSENYVSLLPGDSKMIKIEAAAKDLGNDKPLIVIDGWNVTAKEQTFPENGGASIATNPQAHVARVPAAP